jgi:multidrug efflux pump subunit AcrB
MNPADYAIRNKVVTCFLLLMVAVGGALAYGKLGRLEDPEFTIKQAVIQTAYPGADAEQVELEVTKPLETAIQQLKQLKEVRSISRAGLSIVFAEIQERYDKHGLPQVWDELRRKVEQAERGLPPGCGRPAVNDDFGDVYGLVFALTGEGYPLHDLGEIAEDLRRELLLCRDVGRIDFWGLPTEAVYVEMDRAKLVQLGIAPTAVIQAISHQNAITESGKVEVGPEDIRLRVTGDYGDVDKLAEALIRVGADGRMIRLGDVAVVARELVEPQGEIMLWNGRPAVGMGISTISGGDVVAMGEAVDQRLRSLEARIPLGVEAHFIANQSRTVREAVQGFVFNLVAAVAIVVALLMVFMGLREGLIIGAVLLLTILATFICMYAMGISLQRISLGALVIALGMLVDNAIVVAEGIAMKTRRGMAPDHAARATVQESQWPLLGATGIAILAFAAITLSKDMTGEWLKSLFQVICLSLGLSWVLAIVVTPFFCVAFAPREHRHRASRRGAAFFAWYRRFAAACIDRRWVTLSAVAAMLMAAMWGGRFVKQDFMPDMNRPQITVDVWMPEGTGIDETAGEVNAIGAYVRSLEGVRDVAAFVGRGPLRFLLTFEPEMPAACYGQLLVDLDDFTRIPGLRTKLTGYLEERHSRAVTSVDAFKLGPGGGAVVARLSGPDADVLYALGERVKAVMAADDNTRSIRTDWGRKVKIQCVEFAEARAREIGVTRPELAQALAANFPGISAGTYRQGDDLLPIMLRPPHAQRHGIENVADVHVWSEARQHWVPMGQVTSGLDVGWEIPVVQRLNRLRVLRVFCKQRTGTTDALFRRLRPSVEALELPQGYTLEWGGEHEEQVEANTKLMANVPIAFALMLLISIMLFNTLRHTLIIFLGLPLTIIGVTGAMLLAGTPFGFMAMLGFLSLSGMLIKNEIVLLDQINIELAEGKPPHLAVLDSAVDRVRPVSMAAFTTVLGMTPLLWDAFFAPMAVTIMGGLTFATALTLVVVPVLYCVFFNVKRPGRLTGRISADGRP